MRWIQLLTVAALLCAASPAAAQPCVVGDGIAPLTLGETTLGVIDRSSCQLKADGPYVTWYRFDWPTTGLASIRLSYTGYYYDGLSALLSADGEMVAAFDEEMLGWEDATLWLPAGRYYVQMSQSLNEGFEEIPVEVAVGAPTLAEILVKQPVLEPWAGISARRLCTRVSSDPLSVNQAVRRTLPRPREGCTMARTASLFEPYVTWTDELVMYRFELGSPGTVRLSYEAPGDARAVLLSGRFGDPYGPVNDDPDDPAARPRPLATARVGTPVSLRLQPGEYFVALLTRPEHSSNPYSLEVAAELEPR